MKKQYVGALLMLGGSLVASEPTRLSKARAELLALVDEVEEMTKDGKRFAEWTKALPPHFNGSIDETGRTALMVAAGRRSPIFRVTIKSQNPDVVTRYQLTLAGILARGGRINVVHKKTGMSALSYAVESGNVDNVRDLLQAGAQVAIAGAGSPLVLAEKIHDNKTKEAIIELLKSHGARELLTWPPRVTQIFDTSHSSSYWEGVC